MIILEWVDVTGLDGGTHDWQIEKLDAELTRSTLALSSTALMIRVKLSGAGGSDFRCGDGEGAETAKAAKPTNRR